MGLPTSSKCGGILRITIRHRLDPIWLSCDAIFLFLFFVLFILIAIIHVLILARFILLCLLLIVYLFFLFVIIVLNFDDFFVIGSRRLGRLEKAGTPLAGTAAQTIIIETYIYWRKTCGRAASASGCKRSHGADQRRSGGGRGPNNNKIIILLPGDGARPGRSGALIPIRPSALGPT